MLIPVILSGGAGSRLWPVSREAHPKPFIRLGDGRSLLQHTLERATLFDDVTVVVTVTNKEHYFITKDEYSGAGAGLDHVFVLEPCARNTAPAITEAAFFAASGFGKDSTLLVLPADHLIEDKQAFAACVEEARRLASDGLLVTFGIPPTRPETGFGYIECAERGALKGHGVTRFIEKPSPAVAQQLAASGNALWNSGIFCFTAEAFLKALRQCDRSLYEKSRACWEATPARSHDRIDLDPERFAALPDISVDYAVMEKCPDVAVVKAGFKWNDIGSWTTLGELVSADAQGNRSVGETILVNARDCYIRSESRLVAAVGVESLVIVDTPDALLVASKEQAQDVRQIVGQLKRGNHPAHVLHRTVHRPWGTYTVLEAGPGYQIKRIVVKPGSSLSLQLHRRRSEHWVVLSGTAKVTNEEQLYTVSPGESTFIPVGHKHRLQNPGAENLVVIEVQAGDYVGEDDIVRFEDVYGRS